MNPVLNALCGVVISSLAISSVASCGSETSTLAGTDASAAAEPTADKAGNEAAPVMLTLAVASRPGRPTHDGAVLFAEAVAEASEGSVTVDVVDLDELEIPGIDFEWEVIRTMLDGTYDMALVPARAWSNEDVHSLDALQLPLIESDEQADRVAMDPVSEDLLAGLRGIGVTGLALLPEALRHVVVLDARPITTADDFEGLTLRAAKSSGTYALIEALGATASDPAELATMVEQGTINGAETGLSLMHTLPTVNGPASAVANLTLYAEFGVLGIRTSAIEELPPSVQAVLNEAASAALTAKIASRPRQADLLASRCADGYRIAALPPEQLAIAHERLAAVETTLAADPTTATLIERVRSAAGTSTAPPVTPCNSEGSTVASAQGSDDGFPSGTFRSAGLSVEELRTVGLEADTALDWEADQWELTFDDGVVTERMIRDGEVVTECRYAYTVDGDEYTVSGHNSDCGWTGAIYTARWTFDGEKFTEQVIERFEPDGWTWDEISQDILKVD